MTEQLSPSWFTCRACRPWNEVSTEGSEICLSKPDSFYGLLWNVGVCVCVHTWTCYTYVSLAIFLLHRKIYSKIPFCLTCSERNKKKRFWQPFTHNFKEVQSGCNTPGASSVASRAVKAASPHRGYSWGGQIQGYSVCCVFSLSLSKYCFTIFF